MSSRSSPSRRSSSKRTRSDAEADSGRAAQAQARGGGGGRRRRQDEPEGEDLLDDRVLRADYRELKELDTYDAGRLDEADYDHMTMDQRRAAEAEMARRDAAEGGMRPELGEEFGEGEAEETYMARQGRMKRLRSATAGAEDGADDDDDEAEDYAPFDIGTFDGPLREWIAQEATQQEVKRRFRRFLNAFTDSQGVPVYERQIEDMCAANSASLEVSYLHMSQAVPMLAIWLADAPKDMFELLDDVAMKKTLQMYPAYDRIVDQVHVRVTNLPISDSLRELRHMHLNALIKVTGVVTRRTGIFPQLKVARYTCQGCMTVTPPVTVPADGKMRVGQCATCESRGPFVLNSEQTVYGNYQKIALQETPGSVPAGRVPRYKDVILLGDLVDSCRPGEEVEITGVYTHSYDAGLNMRQGFPVFSTVLEANYVRKKHETSISEQLTDDDIQRIQELSRDPRIGQRIVRSIAPSIYGHDHVKMAVALSMFGAKRKDAQGKHKIRGDINVLLLGDPGTAKSQMLKYVETTAPRAVYTTGKGASAVGLTASVHRDPVTGEWTLEGGALVLADRGVCLIDEFDKMNDQDRTSIHEAMEQQSISISKAGIVTSLQARCAVLAAANPIGGRYDPSKTFAENVQLTDPILQRFDVLCVLLDTVDVTKDEAMARFITTSHMASHPAAKKEQQARDDDEAGAASGAAAGGDVATPPRARLAALSRRGADELVGDDVEPLDQDTLRKYILYSRKTSAPSLANINQEQISSLYAELRRESEVSQGVPIAVRHIESIMRLAEAHARMHLRPAVNSDDVDMAIRIMLESFIQAQKVSVMKALRKQFGRYLRHKRDFSALLMIKLRDIVREQMSLRELDLAAARADEQGTGPRIEVRVRELEDRARRHDLADYLPTFLKGRELRAAGFEYNASRKVIIKQLGV